MVTDKRFRVESSDGMVKVFGYLADSVKFSIFDEHLKGEHVEMDFGQLEGSTWNALVELDRVLKERAKKVSLYNLPYSFFRKLKYMPDFFEFYEVKTCSLQYFNQSDNTLKVFEIKDPVGAWSEDKKEFIQQGSKQILLGKKHYFLGEYPSDEPNFSDYGSYIEENSEEINFWLDYTSFYLSSIVLCQDLAQCIRFNFANIYNEVMRLVKDFVNISIVDNAKHKEALAKLEREYAKSDKQAESLNQELDTIAEATELEIGRFIYDISSQSIQDQEALHSRIRTVFGPTDKLNEVAALVEQIGSSLGGAILEFPVSDILNDIVQKLDTLNPEGEALENVREELKIMNPMTEDSWEETKEDVSEEMDHCEKQYFAFMTTVQGLDLLRQVLEHRFTEHGYILDYLKGGHSWQIISEKVIDNVQDRAVTDQEKFTSKFYLDRFQKKEKGDSAPPGDMLLF